MITVARMPILAIKAIVAAYAAEITTATPWCGTLSSH
jgi:hypothetical protein